jgi:hypothetical protein
VLGAGSGLAAGFDFATVGNILPHETTDFFVINFVDMVVTKLADFATWRTVSPAFASLPRVAGPAGGWATSAIAPAGTATPLSTLHDGSPFH